MQASHAPISRYLFQRLLNLPVTVLNYDLPSILFSPGGVKAPELVGILVCTTLYTLK